ncbi:MAG: tetratricopeptide repeat protein [Ignavibacteria bacterium]|nr:tetratricopeptide repeat protein [Ignavibacteria bacterium]MBT8391149.1 tetratricopeptide repeat protein [Ignavibacteria bacterium]NNJ54272.1 tetratricopeptide repeat protein [Ignavibacteriaceae bacterium]NNL20237.1 tetratricopeptide repeat protein [Ignavibacteriaceae bacterium]
MKSPKFFLMIALLLGITFMGFQCSSTELTSARLYIQQKNFDKALEVLKEDVAKNPKSDEGYYLLGYVYGEKGELDNMIEAFDQSSAISNKFSKDINDSRAYHWANSFNKGVNLFQRGNKTVDVDSSNMYYKMSVDAYKGAIKVQPDSTETYRNLAFVYLTMGKNEDSIEPLQKLVELEKSEDGYQYLGEVYYTLASNKMIDFRNDANAQDSVDGIEMYNKAIEVLEEGRKLYPENAEMLVALSNSYIGADKIDVAMDAFKEGVEKEPENKFYRYNYGVLLLGAEMFEDAETQFKKAIEIDSEYENAIYNLAVTYVKWGTDLNKKAEEQGVISEDYKEKYQMALPYLEKVVEKDAENVQIWELLGKVYSVLGMQEDAENAFKKADELR